MVIAKLGERKLRGQGKGYERIPSHNAGDSMNGNADVLVDVAKLIQSPEEMVLRIRRSRCGVVGLKGFDDFSRVWRHTAGLPIKPRNVRLL